MSTSLSRRIAVGCSFVLFALLLSACGAAASAQQSDQQKAGALLNTGLAAHSAGRPAEAAADYRKALTYDPQNKWAHYNLGVIEQLNGQKPAAEADYRSVLAIDPNFTGALYNLAIIRADAAPLEAVDLYRRAITVMPSMGSAHLNLGFLLQSLGRQAEGKAQLDQAVAIEPALAKRIPVVPKSPSTSPKKP